MKKSLYITCLALVVLLSMLLALAPAKAQTVVYQGDATPLNVVQNVNHTYEWELYSDFNVNFATTSGNCPVTSAVFVAGNIGSNVMVKWLLPGIYFFKVTARDAAKCAMNIKIGMIKVIPPDLKAVISGAAITGACQLVKLDASKSFTDIVKYEWSILDKGGALTRQTGIDTEFLLQSTYTGSLPANFRVRLQVTSRSGNVNSDTLTIKVDRLPVAGVFTSGEFEKNGSMMVDGTVSTGTGLKYRWFTSEGQVVGANNLPTAYLYGAGIYSLEVIDNFGCKSIKSFKFPLENHQIMANTDYARTSWAQDTTINVLANDVSNLDLVPGSVHVVEQPTRGKTKVNADGSITYMPSERRPARDQFVYEVCDVVNLCSSATVIIDIYDSGVTAPEGFSPNGDGQNEYLVFKGLENYQNSQLFVYTRAGQLVYQSLDYLNDWDGTTVKSSVTNTQLVPSGTYYYILNLGGTNRLLKGFVYIGY